MYRKIRHYVQEFVFMRSPGIALVRGSSIILQLLFVSLVTRFAGAATAGSFFSTYAAVLLASSVSRLGAEHFLVAYLPRMSETDRSLRITTLNVTIGIMTCTFLITSLIVRTYSEITLFGDSLFALLLFWMTVLLLSLNWSNVGAIRGLGDHLKSVTLESLLYLTVFLVALVTINSLGSATENQLLLLLVCSIGLSVLVGGVLVSRFGVRPVKPGVEDVSRSIFESMPFWLASALAVANAWLPILLLGQLAPPEDVSTYLLSQRLAASMLFGLMILNARFAREYARLMSERAIGELRALYRRNTIAQLPFVVTVAVLLVAFAPLVFQFSGVTDEHAYAILVVLALGTFASAVCGPIVTASLATGSANAVSTIIAGTLFVSIGIILALWTRLDGLLLAYVVAITMAVQNLAMYFWWSSRMKKLCK